MHTSQILQTLLPVILRQRPIQGVGNCWINQLPLLIIVQRNNRQRYSIFHFFSVHYYETKNFLSIEFNLQEFSQILFKYSSKFLCIPNKFFSILWNYFQFFKNSYQFKVILNSFNSWNAFQFLSTPLNFSEFPLNYFQTSWILLNSIQFFLTFLFFF